jgi:hydroxyethylthiazole kinase
MISAGATLQEIRERKPLVHQITNYVVMNETANATLALGAVPVMAHAGEEVEEMARLASSLVLNTGTLSDHWVEAMLLAGGTASARQIPVAREAARRLGVIASVTGPVDHVSDGERVLAVANGHALLETVTGTGCLSSALTGCFLAAKPDLPLEAAAEALAAFGVAAEDAATGAQGPGTFHARLCDALYALDPADLDGRTRIEEL